MKEFKGLVAAAGGKRRKLVLQLSEFDDRRLINVRNWFVCKDTGEWSPTKKGISLSKDKFDFIFNAFVENEEELRAWLAEDGVPDNVKKDYAAAVASRDELAFGAKPYVRDQEPWKSPEFFRLEGQGGTDRLVLNSTHRLALNAARTDQGAAIDALLVSFGRAMRLFDAETRYSLDEFMDLLMSNWGLILDRYLQGKQGAP